MKKIILTSVMAILSLSVNVMAAKPNVMNDTMSYRNMADLKDSGGWKVVGSTNTIVDQQYAKLIMENDGTSVCDNGIIKEFSSYLSGYATIEFDFMQQSEKSNCRIMDLRGYQEDKSSNARMVCFVDISQGNVIARGEGHGDMGTGTVIIEDYEADCWYNIKISVDTNTNNLCFYVNNELKAQMKSLQTFESISAIKFATNNATDTSKTKENGANICIDNVFLSISETGNSIKNISVTNNADELFAEGVIKSELNLMNIDSIKTQEYLLFSTLYKNKVIVLSDTATMAAPFGYADKLTNEIPIGQTEEDDILEVKNYLFFKMDENKYKIADAVAITDEGGMSYSEGDFSVAVDNANVVTADIEYGENEIIINGSLDKSGSAVNAFVFEDEVPQQWDFDKIVSISGAKSGADNGFSIAVELGTGFTSGEYAVLLMCDNTASGKELGFIYVSEDQRNTFVGTVSDFVDEEDDVALAEYLQDEDNLKLMKSMNIIFKENIAYDFSAISQYIINKGGITNENLSTIINEAVAYTIIAQSSESDIYNNLVLYGSYVGVTPDEQIFADEEIKYNLLGKLLEFDYSTVNDAQKFSQYYKSAIALIKLNNAEFSELESVILGNNDIFKVNMTEYNNLSGLNRAKVMQALAGLDIDTIETDVNGNTNIAQIFSDIVKGVIEEMNSQNSSNQGGSGGGSGGGGAGGTSDREQPQNAGIKIDIEVENIKKEEKKSMARPFTDLGENHWAYDDIYYLFDNGIMSGVNENEVNPDRAVLREEFIKMVVAAFFEIDTRAENNFSDVDRDKWFAPSVSTAVKYSLIQGFDGKFGTGSDIRKQDAILILLNVVNVKGIELIESEYYINDIDDVSDYALVAVKKLAAAGIISGDENKNFSPIESLTRAEAAVLIRKCIELMK